MLLKTCTPPHFGGRYCNFYSTAASDFLTLPLRCMELKTVEYRHQRYYLFIYVLFIWNSFGPKWRIKLFFQTEKRDHYWTKMDFTMLTVLCVRARLFHHWFIFHHISVWRGNCCEVKPSGWRGSKHGSDCVQAQRSAGDEDIVLRKSVLGEQAVVQFFPSLRKETNLKSLARSFFVDDFLPVGMTFD